MAVHFSQLEDSLLRGRARLRHYKELHELALSGGGTARDGVKVCFIHSVRRGPSGAIQSVDADEPSGVRA